jgi:hypothetical protein
LKTILRRLKSEKRGVSNVLVVMLSLILITVIVANVVLWNYQMNQLDIERMHESVKITEVSRLTRSAWSTAQNEFTAIKGNINSGSYIYTRAIDDIYETFREEAETAPHYSYPSSYNLIGGTSLVSGSLLDLQTNNDVYMILGSYATGDKNFVDQQSNVDGSPDKGTHSNFTAMKYGPDGIYDTLTEADTGGYDVYYLGNTQLTGFGTDYRALTTTSGTADTTTSIKHAKNTGYFYFDPFTSSSTATGTPSATALKGYGWGSNGVYGKVIPAGTWQFNLTLQETSATGNGHIEIWVYKCTTTGGSVTKLFNIDATGTNVLATTATTKYTFTYTSTSSFDLTNYVLVIEYWLHVTTAGTSATGTLKMTTVSADSSVKIPKSNYQLDLEVQWVNANYTRTNEYLCIRTGALNSENLQVDVWTGSSWTTVITALTANAWNNVSVSDYLTSSTFTIRFKATDETNDLTQSSWQIDCALLYMERDYVQVEFVGNSTTEDWMQIVWAVDCSSTVSSVNITLQLYDYNASEYATSGDGFMTATIGTEDVTLNQTITVNPSRFRDAYGNWKMKIVGEGATPFNFKIDLIEIKITSPSVYRLEISNIFTIALSEYPLNYIYGLEIMVRYNVSEASERWFIKAYDWSSGSFSDVGFNFTEGNQPAANEWNNYTVSININWTRYVGSDGTIQIMFCDEGISESQTYVCIDFIGVRVILNGISLDIKNSGATTVHIIALWIINATHHMRYDLDFFVNPGESATCMRVDITLPQGNFVVKIVTERGNIDTF